MSVSGTTLDTRHDSWQSRAVDASAKNVSLNFSGILDQLSTPDPQPEQQSPLQYDASSSQNEDGAAEGNDESKAKEKSKDVSSGNSTVSTDASNNPLAALLVQQPVERQAAAPAEEKQQTTAVDSKSETPSLTELPEVKPQEASPEIQKQLQQQTAQNVQQQPQQDAATPVLPQASAQVATTQQQGSSNSQGGQQASGSSEGAQTQQFQLATDSPSAKIDSVTYNGSQQSGQQSSQQGQSGANQQDILKSLLGKQSNYAAAAARGQDAAAAQQAASASVATQAKALVESSTASVTAEASVAAKASALKESFSQGSGKGMTTGESSTQNLLFSGDSTSSGSGLQGSAKTSAQSSVFSSLSSSSSLQDLVDKMPSALRGANIDSKASFSMDVSIDGLGHLKVSIERDGDKIAVNVQTGDSSSKEQLADQKESLESEMRKLGYKDVSVDIGSGNSSNGSNSSAWRRSGSSLGNAATEDNVKLSHGDDSADLSQILAMNN